jgi:hypothetical protein
VLTRYRESFLYQSKHMAYRSLGSDTDARCFNCKQIALDKVLTNRRTIPKTSLARELTKTGDAVEVHSR